MATTVSCKGLEVASARTARLSVDLAFRQLSLSGSQMCSVPRLLGSNVREIIPLTVAHVMSYGAMFTRVIDSHRRW